MTRRAVLIGTTVTALALAGGCASGKPSAGRVVKVAGPSSSAPLLLAQLDGGIGAVSVDAPTPVWMELGAVAAADGSAVFSIRRSNGDASDLLVGLDPRTGEVSSSWPLRDAGLSVGAVAPDGRWVALTDREFGYGNQGRASTEVVLFETRTGAEARRMALKGDVQPEAFSVDGKLVFALDYRADHYRVQTIEPATGMRYDTSDRDKTLPPEDMHGTSVHGVMSADRTLLATLYRNPGDDEEPAFVHVLDLAHGWSYCADLPPPFGTGPSGTDSIELTRAGTIVVAATRFNRLAEIHIDDVRTPADTPVRIEFRDGAVTSADAPFRSMPGFDHVIAAVPT